MERTEIKEVRYFAGHKINKNTFQAGFDTVSEAKAQAEWLAGTYGGVARVGANFYGAPVEKYSVRRGWH